MTRPPGRAALIAPAGVLARASIAWAACPRVPPPARQARGEQAGQGQDARPGRRPRPGGEEGGSRRPGRPRDRLPRW